VEVVCKNCGRHYKIADDKLPSKGTAYFTCPNCKGHIKVEIPAKKASLSKNEEAGTIRPGGFESFEPGAKTALVYCTESQTKEQLWKDLGYLGYEVRSINRQDDIKSRFRYHVYNLVFLCRNGPDPDNNLSGIQEYINTLRMDIRRNTFIVYVHPGGNRFDSMQAFSRGMDLTISPLELKNLTTILPQALEAKDVAYRVYFECKARVEAATLEFVAS